uniref:Uncharacterized protein n=1 Tax=Globodera pallida TaxID=36090 RepID=A0A183BY17_GLOPA
MAWFESRLLRSARPFVPGGGGPCRDGVGGSAVDDQAMVQMMCDLVLGEIQAEISKAEKETERRRQEELRLTNRPDYSWLVDWRLRAKRPLGFRESSEVELLCAKVRPEEWRRLLKEWRTRVRFVESRDEVLDTFRTVVDELATERMRRECLVESVDEHLEENQSKLPTMAQTKQKQRPKSARTRHYPAQLSVFALTLPDEGNV